MYFAHDRSFVGYSSRFGTLILGDFMGYTPFRMTVRSASKWNNVPESLNFLM
jgi:hypothetical protein